MFTFFQPRNVPLDKRMKFLKSRRQFFAHSPMNYNSNNEKIVGRLNFSQTGFFHKNSKIQNPRSITSQVLILPKVEIQISP